MDGVTQAMDSGSIKRLPDGSFALELSGSFPPEWAGSLCAGLSARRISVERGFAKQVRRGTWESLFVLRPMDPGIKMEQVNYRAIAMLPKRQKAEAKPKISSFKLETKGGALSVSIRAPDELGLLGRLLGSFSFLMLFVHEMQFQTVGREAQDLFVLRGLAGMAPSEEACARLAASLQAMSGGEQGSPVRPVSTRIAFRPSTP